MSESASVESTRSSASRKSNVERIRDARAQLIDFAQIMHPDERAPDNWNCSSFERAAHARAIAKALQKTEAGEYRRLIVTTPPRVGKSTLIKLLAAWTLGRDSRSEILLVTYTGDLSSDFGRDVRRILNSERFRRIFPDCRLAIQNAATDNLITTEGGSLRAVGRGGAITGRGARLILVDDIFRGAEDAASRLIRDKTWNWFVSDLLPRLTPDPATGRDAVILTSTRWNPDDVIGRLIDPASDYYDEKTAREWALVELRAIAGTADPLGREPGEALWPSRYPPEKLDEQRRLMGPEAFDTLYQCNPAPTGSGMINPDHLREYDPRTELPPLRSIVLSCDFALTSKQQQDFSALVLVGVDETGDWFVLPETQLIRQPVDQLVETVANMIVQSHPDRLLMESGVIYRAVFPFLRQRLLELGVNVPIEKVPTAGVDKTARATALVGRLGTGRVFFPKRESWWIEAEDQMLRFPRARHDDFVDALALAAQRIPVFAPSSVRPRTMIDAAVGSPKWFWDQTRAQEREQRAMKAREGW